MQCITVVCNVSLLDLAEELLRQHGVETYYVIPKAYAESRFDVPHRDTGTWPGYASVVQTIVENDHAAAEIIEAIEAMNATAISNADLIYAYTTEVKHATHVEPISPSEQGWSPRGGNE